MDFETSLRRTIKTGTVRIGQESTKSSIQAGKAKMVIVADNCPEEFKQYLNELENLFAYVYEGSSTQLGKACGKPFFVSALVIEDAGESDILNLKKV